MIDPPALKWLRMLHGRSSDWIEVRWSPKGQDMRREYRRTRDHTLTILAGDFLRWAQHGDVFCGVAPRLKDRREKGGGGKDNIAPVWALWADCDSRASVELLGEFTPEPTMVIGSGSGGNCHAYWSLSKPVAPAWAELGNARLAAALEADPRCAEPARILRPPGSRNWKQDPPTDVTLLWETGLDHPFSFVADLPEIPAPKPKAQPTRVSGDHDLSHLSAVEYVPALTGRPINGQGYVQCPFHANGKERTPSLMPYEDPSRGWHCFGCGASGDIYVFGARLWDLSTRSDFKEIKRRLSEAL